MQLSGPGHQANLATIPPVILLVPLSGAAQHAIPAFPIVGS
jgi:hypothetical protein